MKVKILHVHLFIQKADIHCSEKSFKKSKCTLFDFKALKKTNRDQDVGFHCYPGGSTPVGRNYLCLVHKV